MPFMTVNVSEQDFKKMVNHTCKCGHPEDSHYEGTACGLLVCDCQDFEQKPAPINQTLMLAELYDKLALEFWDQYLTNPDPNVRGAAGGRYVRLKGIGEALREASK